MGHLAWEGEIDQLPRLSVGAEEVDSFLGGGTGEGEGEGRREDEETERGEAPVEDWLSQDFGGGEGGVLGLLGESGTDMMEVEEGEGEEEDGGLYGLGAEFRSEVFCEGEVVSRM